MAVINSAGPRFMLFAVKATSPLPGDTGGGAHPKSVMLELGQAWGSEKGSLLR